MERRKKVGSRVPGRGKEHASEKVERFKKGRSIERKQSRDEKREIEERDYRRHSFLPGIQRTSACEENPKVKTYSKVLEDLKKECSPLLSPTLGSFVERNDLRLKTPREGENKEEGEQERSVLQVPSLYDLSLLTQKSNHSHGLAREARIQ